MAKAEGSPIRPARPADAEAIARIHNQGIEEGNATFQTRLRTPEGISDAIAHWILCLVCERDGEVVGFAKAGPYEDSSRYYEGIGEATVFVARDARGQGVGHTLLEGLCDAAGGRDLHKLTAKILDGNEASVALFEACGFRVVGTHRRHGRLEGAWRDVILMERSLGGPGREAEEPPP